MKDASRRAEEIPSSRTIHRIPRKHHHCTLNNFRWEDIQNGSPKREAVVTFLDAWGESQSPHLIIVGRPGRGKTHVAVGIYRVGVFRRDLLEAVFVHVPSFCDDVKRSFNTEDDPFDDVRNASLLVLDDIFGRELSNWEHEQVIPRLLALAYDNAAALVVTTNYDKKGISSKLHPHESSRLFSNATYMEFIGDDQRL